MAIFQGVISAAAKAIHETLPVVDGHNDLPWKLRAEAGGDLAAANPSSDLPGFHTDIGRMLEGGIGAQFWSVYVPTDSSRPFEATLGQIELVKEMVQADHRLELAQTGSDVRAIRSRSHIGSLLGAEGGHSIESSLDNLHTLSESGVRYMTLTHSDTTTWADSATDTPSHGGLSPFGVDVVKEMNRLGVLVDISHVSEDTMRHAIDVSEAPVIASHSNARALADHPRNIPDDVLRQIGASGGVAMAVFFPGFLVDSTARQMTAMFQRLRRVREEHAGDEARIASEWERLESSIEMDRGTVGDVANHIEHIAEVAGIDSVGLGSDFDGMTATPVGLEDVSCYPAITDELLERGWDETEIRKVLGENTLRVLDTLPAF